MTGTSIGSRVSEKIGGVGQALIGSTQSAGFSLVLMVRAGRWIEFEGQGS